MVYSENPRPDHGDHHVRTVEMIKRLEGKSVWVVEENGTPEPYSTEKIVQSVHLHARSITFRQPGGSRTRIMAFKEVGLAPLDDGTWSTRWISSSELTTSESD